MCKFRISWGYRVSQSFLVYSDWTNIYISVSIYVSFQKQIARTKRQFVTALSPFFSGGEPPSRSSKRPQRDNLLMDYPRPCMLYRVITALLAIFINCYFKAHMPRNWCLVRCKFGIHFRKYYSQFKEFLVWTIREISLQNGSLAVFRNRPVHVGSAGLGYHFYDVSIHSTELA